MKRIKIILCITLALIICSACNKKPKPIDYGNDGCHFCKMTIVDKIHGSELITDKGKIFRFDATECMLNYISDNQDLRIGSVLTNYYEAPTELIIVQEATYLISENLPSPMGANLTAFSTQEGAEEIRSIKGGKLYTWESLRSHFAK